MKKKIFMLLALFAGVLSASADDVITVSSALIPEGKSGTFGIELTNTGGYAGFQVDLTLPTGVTFVSVAKTSRIPDDWTFSDNYDSEHPSSTIRIVGHYNKNANPIITGNSGNFLIVTVSLEGSSAKAGDLLPCSLTNMEVTPTGTTTAQKVADFNFNIEVSDKVILDEASTVVPATQNSVDVLVKRTISKNVWNTICLPFAMTKAQYQGAFGTDVKIARLPATNGITKVEEGSYKIKFTEFTDDMAANTPYLIKTTNDYTEFTVDGVNVAPEAEPKRVCNAFDGEDITGKLGTMYGTMKAGIVIPKDNFFLSGNKFYYSTGSTTIKGFRAYIEVVGFSSSVGAPEVDFVVDGETTKVEGINVIFDDGQYYNLKGQKVDNPTEKGVYIKNGKKVVIK